MKQNISVSFSLRVELKVYECSSQNEVDQGEAGVSFIIGEEAPPVVWQTSGSLASEQRR